MGQAVNPDIIFIDDAEIFRSDGDYGTAELIGSLGAEANAATGNMIPYELRNLHRN